MSFTGEFKRIPFSELDRLLADPASIQDALYPDEEPPDRNAWFTIDKAFDAIHHLLRRLASHGRIPLVAPVPWFASTSHEDETGAELHYGPVYCRTVEQTCEIAAILARVSREDLREVYDPEDMMESGVYPKTWDRGEGEFEYIWHHFEHLRDFYATAARSGEGLLLWLG